MESKGEERARERAPQALKNMIHEVNDQNLDESKLQDFLIAAVPSFREECLANRQVYGTGDNFYFLLADFRDHIAGLFKSNRSKEFRTALQAVASLFERGTDNVRDAAAIEVIHVIIQDPDLMAEARKWGPQAVSREMDRAVHDFEEFRRNNPGMMRDGNRWS